MDIELKSPTSLLLTSVVFILIFLKLITKLKTNPKHPPPPGPWKLPIIGNMHNLAGPLPHRTLHKLALKYGPVMNLQLGELTVVLISSSEAAKEVLKTKDINFASRTPFLLSQIMTYNGKSIGTAPYGEYWRFLKKICTLELLSPKRVQSFRSTREEVYLGFMRWLASNEGTPVNLTEKFYSTTVAIVSRTAFGDESPHTERVVELFKEALELGTHMGVADMFPSIGLLRAFNGHRRRLLQLHGEADKHLEVILREHKEALKRKKEGKEEKQEDLVDVLLKFQTEDENEFSLGDDNVKAVLVDILGGGSDTSTTVLDWALAHMMHQPELLARAQEEVRGAYDEKGYVDESKISELKYLKAVIKETLRLHTTLLLPRRCREACEIMGYSIPVDAKVIVSPWAIHRDPESWEDAETFKPERFMENPVDYRGNDFDYVPFGGGRRMCPGLTFGLANVELPLAMLLYHFDWSLPEGLRSEDMEMGEATGMVFRRKEDLTLVPRLKRPLSSSVPPPAAAK